MIKLYIANLGKYNEGILKGSYLTLPATEEEIQLAKVEAGVAHFDNEGNFIPYVIETDENGWEYVYEEYAIHDWECEVEGIKINEYSCIDKLNEIAETLEGADEYEIKQAEALCEGGYYNDMMEALENLDNHCFTELDQNTFISDDLNLAYTVIDEIYGGVEELPENTLESYFDYYKFGKDLYNFDFELITEDMEEQDKEELENLSYTGFADWYIEGLGSVAELGKQTLENYFNYKMYGQDLQFEGVYIASNGIVVM
jgi:antirestriction protein